MGTFSFLLCMIAIVKCDEESVMSDINDLFPSFNDVDQPTVDPAGKSNASFTIDLEKIDINKFKNKIMGDLKSKIEKEDFIVQKDGRKTAIEWYTKLTPEYIRASGIAANQVGVDMILQLVYMAKSQVSALESEGNFNSKDTSFRIGFTYLKLKKYFKRMTNILSYMHKNNFKNYFSIIHISMHHKCVKLHVDFLYYYWVMVKLDGIYRDRINHKPKLPKDRLKDGGISLETKVINQRPIM